MHDDKPPTFLEFMSRTKNGYGGRPALQRLPAELADRFRADVRRRFAGKDLSLTELVGVERRDLPERSERWLQRAMGSATTLPVTTAI